MTTISNFKCPVCGNQTLTEKRMWEICPICNWEDDEVQFLNPNLRGGANFFSLNEYRKFFKQGKDIQQLEVEAKAEHTKKVKAEYAEKIRTILRKRIDFGSSDYWTQENKKELIDFVKENSFEFMRFRKESATEKEKSILDESGINFENCKTRYKEKRNNSLFAD
ncbi:CPCC family cysteine-rich protein [Treponema zioleckii]|uniref:CPCC family cysteine-rich protein n=1 Tax=Treponema zioleckii TaxID=331680 RepID=UPI00168B6301|nr:CPCC family cysteine-rich protein [Treponema zioleckii]